MLARHLKTCITLALVLTTSAAFAVGGRTVDKAKSPLLYEALQEIFNNLSLVQTEMLSDRYAAVNTIAIVDSPELNAWVTTKKENGTRIVRNDATITTGLIDLMMKGQDGAFSTSSASINAGFARIAGVLAHELAHPLDNYDSDGVKDRVGQKAGSQAREIRADADGVEISRRAGYPTNSVYMALSRLFTMKAMEAQAGEPTAAVNAGFGSHPPDEMRLSAQRFLLTVKRYKSGTYRADVQPKYRPGLIRELQVRKLEERAIWQFVLPKSVHETLTRMQALQKVERSEVYTKLEYNRLMLALDLQLKDVATLLPADETLYREVRASEFELKTKRRIEAFTIYGREKWDKEFRLAREAYRPKPERDHFERQSDVLYYNTPSYIAWIKTLGLLDNSGKGLRFFEIKRAAEFLSPRLLFTVYKNELLDDILAKSLHRNFDGDGFFSDLSQNMKELNPSLVFEFMNLYYTDVFDRVSPWNKLILATDSVLAMKKDVSKSLSRVPSDQLRIVLEKIWKERGFFGASEFFKSDRHQFIDWEFVFANLGIEPKQGYRDLLDSTKTFTQSAEYATMLNPEVSGKRGGGRTVSFVDYTITAADSPGWEDVELYRYLAGDHNSHMTEGARRVAKAIPAKIYSLADGKKFQQVFVQQFILELKEPSKAEFDLAFRQTLSYFDLKPENVVKNEVFYLAVQRLQVSEAKRRELTIELFGQKLPIKSEEHSTAPRKIPSGVDWVEDRQGRLNKQVLETLIQENHFNDSLDVLLHWANSVVAGKYANTERFRYFNPKAASPVDLQAVYGFFMIVSDFSTEIARDLKARLEKTSSLQAKKRLFNEVLESLIDPGKGRYITDDVAQTNNLRALKGQLLLMADGLSLSLSEKRLVFERVVATGPSLETDQWALKTFSELQGSNASDRDGRRWLEKILKRGRIFDLGLQAKLVKRFVEPRIAALKRQKTRKTNELDELITQILELMPSGSRHRDQLLEKLAWDLDISGVELNGFIEDRKTLNWRRPNPLLVNAGSVAVEKIEKLTPKSRLLFLNYLIHRKSARMPNEIWLEIKTQSQDEARLLMGGVGALRKAANSKYTDAEIDEFAAGLADKVRIHIERAIQDASPLELVPFIEIVVESGSNALSREPGYPLTLIREYLKYEPHSIEEKLLLSYLDVIEPHERSVSLAYMLSHSGQDKSSVKSVFEVFQTAGIKFGQLASMMKFLGPRIAREAAALKDNAEPMSRAEIEAILKARPEAAGLRLKRVLGSASIKTVIEVEYEKNGITKTAVLALQRPDAANQVATNIEMGRKLLMRLKERGIDVPESLITVYLEDLESQIREELQMKVEASKIHEVQRAVAKTMPLLKMNKANYKVVVPGMNSDYPPQDDFLVIEKAEGLPLRYFQPGAMDGDSEDAARIRQTLSAQFHVTGSALKEIVSKVWSEAAPVAGELSLRMGFRSGWFEADRHSGNFLVDPTTKTLSFIDIAQAEHWASTPSPLQSDERYDLARFLKGVADRNVQLIVSHAAALSKVQLSHADQRRLEDALTKLNRLAPEDYPVEIMNSMIANGLRLPRKLTLGVLRELLIVQGEGYLPSKDFNTILTEEIALIHAKKAPLVAKQIVTNAFKRRAKPALSCSELFIGR